MHIFLSTPISCFKNKKELLEYKNRIMPLILALEQHHTVCSEVKGIGSPVEYDSPTKSIKMDMDAIKKCELFIMHYPFPIPTSALIELGFAIAFQKRIIITPDKSKLPYLTLGIPSTIKQSAIIEAETINNTLIQGLLCLTSE